MKSKKIFTGFILVKMVDMKTGETLYEYETNSSEVLKDEEDNYVYILITNYNPIDFQSFIIKYESWEKFKNSFINPTKDKEKIIGTLSGEFRFNDFEVDWHDEFHMRLTNIKRKTYGEKTCVYLVDKNIMNNFVGFCKETPIDKI